MQIDWWTLAIQTVNFLIVAWVLTRLLYRPVRRVIEQREAQGRELQDKTEKAAAEAEAARLDYERKRAELDEVLRAREAELHAALQQERDDMLARAGAQADALIAEARDRVEREEADAVTALQDRIAGLAEALARTALQDAGETPESTVDRVGRYLDGLSDADRDELGRDLAGDDGRLVVVSTAELSEGLKDRWGTALRARFGGGIVLAFEDDPAILGGVELRFPHSIIRFSVADRLRAAAEGLKG